MRIGHTEFVAEVEEELREMGRGKSLFGDVLLPDANKDWLLTALLPIGLRAWKGFWLPGNRKYQV